MNLIVSVAIHVLLMVRLQSLKFVNGASLSRFKCHFHNGLWGVIISFPFVKEGPVYPVLKVI